MTVARTKGWQNRLTSYLTQSARTPFEPGVHDCALFAAGAVAAMTGYDPARAYRDRYTTVRGGVRILRKDGHADHIALAASLFRARPPGEAAKPGDLAGIGTDGGHALGVVQGRAVYALSRSGLALVALPPDALIFAVP